MVSNSVRRLRSSVSSNLKNMAPYDTIRQRIRTFAGPEPASTRSTSIRNEARAARLLVLGGTPGSDATTPRTRTPATLSPSMTEAMGVGCRRSADTHATETAAQKAPALSIQLGFRQ